MGLNGLIAFALSYIVVMERIKARIWHRETESEVCCQPSYLEHPNAWAAYVESYTQKSVITKSSDDGILQRKVRAYGNFTEYVPLGLLFIIMLELMRSPCWMLWLLGSALTIGRVAHAWGLITTYGPSLGRAVGFFLTWLVYIVGAITCIYYGVIGVLS
ncbi:MAPEG family protein [Synechococcus sp. ATX 2A4]|nr:MAPEG family protein [Synechococcus sp. ATX 2A4]